MSQTTTKKVVPKFSKMVLVKKIALPTLVYNSKSCAPTEKFKRRLNSAEMCLLRQIERKQVKPVKRSMKERQLGMFRPR